MPAGVRPPGNLDAAPYLTRCCRSLELVTLPRRSPTSPSSPRVYRFLHRPHASSAPAGRISVGGLFVVSKTCDWVNTNGLPPVPPAPQPLWTGLEPSTATNLAWP